MEPLDFLNDKAGIAKAKNRKEWGATGNFPAIGTAPPLPAVPPATILPVNAPRVPDPSEESLKSSRETIESAANGLGG
jgi:hypothetical protein